jgi:hypothetical protein
MTTWPSEPFPQLPDRDGWREQFPKNVIETPNDVGAPKSRRRSAAGFRVHTMRITMSGAEVAEFDEFWSTDCGQGSLPFDWVNPRTGMAHSFMFVGATPPDVTNPGGDTYYVSFSVRQLS